jgi:hypothetical protein
MGIDQTESRAVLAAETRNRAQLVRQLPRHRHRPPKRLAWGAIGRQHDRDCDLLWECWLRQELTLMITALDWTRNGPPDLDNNPLPAIKNCAKYCIDLKTMTTEDQMANAQAAAGAFITIVPKTIKDLENFAKSAEGKPKGVSNKACIGFLNRAKTELEKYKKDIIAKSVAHADAVKLLKQKNKGCAADLKKFESAVQKILSDLKKEEGNIGQAEGLINEAQNQLVIDASEIRKNGYNVACIADCLKANDRDFNTTFTFWNDQVNKWVKAQARTEKLWADAVKLYEPIDSLKQEMDDASTLLDQLVSLSQPCAKTFLSLQTDIDKFYKNTRTDRCEKSYQAFRFFGATMKSSHFKKHSSDMLEKLLKKVTSVDAQSYLMEEAAKHGFNERQLKKAIKNVETKQAQVRKLAQDLEKQDIDPKLRAALLVKLLKLRDELVDIDDKYKRGRRNQELANQLAAEMNKAYKKKVEAAMADFSSAAASAEMLCKVLTK